MKAVFSARRGLPMLFVINIFLALALAAPSGDQSIEARAKALEGMIIAPCCWTQPVSNHYSEAASNIRKQIREMLAEGKSEQQILDHYVALYGERILASPPARGFNTLAYIMPWATFFAGAVILSLVIRRRLARKVIPEPRVQSATNTPDTHYQKRIEQELRNLE